MNRKVNGRRRTTKKVLRKSGRSKEIHCMLIPTERENLLLPTNVMAEVLDYQPPEPMDSAPPWLLGQMEWENRQVPVFSFSALINGTDVGEISSRARIIVLKSLADSGRVPYLGMLLGDLPRPVTVNENDLRETGDDKKSLGVFSRVAMDDDEAIVPDLDRLTHLVTHATFGALPITQIDD
ncbi:MAG: chemotaxis protein CheW [Xanthomonadales bacterium]|nr:chemotaxis protein CheW [Gammaproteobacteria bacterium]NNK36969.1 chemotaxis protein CheW [Xanthomonadales bacterium]